MRFCAFREYGSVATGFVHGPRRATNDEAHVGAATNRPDGGDSSLGDRVVSLDDLNDALNMDLGPDLDDFLQRGQEPAFRKALAGPRTPTSGWKPGNLQYAPPLQRPPKIWGVGLNFSAHAADMKADPGEHPAAWMRPASTLAGDGSAVDLPEGVGRVTAEAEIAVVIGKTARKLGSRKEAREAVFGFMPVLDLTAEELLQKNPRYLTQSKSYDGFCITGPFLVTTDEWEPQPTTKIATVIDGQRKEGVVSQMRHDPYELVRHFSHVFAWQPGDILLTGTPGALPLRSGGTMRAEIEGLPALNAKVA